MSNPFDTGAADEFAEFPVFVREQAKRNPKVASELRRVQAIKRSRSTDGHPFSSPSSLGAGGEAALAPSTASSPITPNLVPQPVAPGAEIPTAEPGMVFPAPEPPPQSLADRAKGWGLLGGDFAMGAVPGSGVADAAGYMPSLSAGGEYAPSFWENVKQGQLIDAGLQLGGVGADALTAVAPPLGIAAKGGLSAIKTARAASRAEKAAESVAAAMPSSVPPPAALAPTASPAAAIPNGPVLQRDIELTGSMNPLDEVPFQYKGKDPGDWTPEEYGEVGQKFGVNLGPGSAPEKFAYDDGGEFEIPGGLEGEFSYYDLLSLKAQGVDPSRINRDLHTKIQQKMLRTMTPAEGASDAQVWSGLIFGLTSPNNPLFPNQLTQSRFRMRDPQMMDDLAGMISWEPGANVDPELRKVANHAIGERFGISAAKEGGLGVRGSQDMTRVAELAKMFKEDPAFFRKGADEPWDEFVERISSQVAGLQMKTGSFGTVWQNPAEAAVSAIDRHMVKQFEKTGKLFSSFADQRHFEQRAVTRWNETNPERKVKSFKKLRAAPGTELHIGKMLLEYVGNAGEATYRTAKGDINPNIPEHHKVTQWIKDPAKVLKMGDAYKRALDWNDKIAKKHGLGLFGSQWMEWDRIRKRLEPHENMFPGLEKIPAMSKDQLKQVDLEHRASGHKTYTKDEEQGLRPTKPRPNPSRFGYFGVPVGVGVGAGVAGSGGEEEVRRDQ